ncbi:MAG TPA: VWA domain-containing protein [Bryobacteraceae bacterium]|nr:VWA domain-containing protein [Bryobacteraceae bacterium]
MRCICAFVLAASIGASWNAQGQAPPVIRSETRQVLVPVVVNDRHGHNVPNLKVSDFEVLEDGKPQRIVALGTESSGGVPVPVDGSAVPSPVATGGPAAAANNAAAPQASYLILVDTLHSSFANFGRVREALVKFFAKEPPADAQFAVMALGRELHVVQDSTRDMHAALDAVQASRFANLILDSEASNLAVSAEQFTALMRQYCSLCFCESGGQVGKIRQEMPECPATQNRVQAFLTVYGERAYVLNQAFLERLREVVRATATIPMSRTIVFVSDGFNRFPGRELYAILLGYGPQNRTFEFNSRDTQPELDRVLKLAVNHDVKFYTLDSRGLYTLSSVPGSGFAASSSSSPMNAQVDARTSPNLAAGVPEAVTSRVDSAARENTDVLTELARETGGVFFQNNNDLLKGLRQAISDGRQYYVLAYNPVNKVMDGTYRKITVVAKDPKWRVKAKPGYWATPD